MKVYVITKGSYSDYHICAVAIDKDKAEKLAKLYSEGCDVADIEEYDTESVGKFIEYGHFYTCWGHMANSKISIYDSTPDFLDSDEGKIMRLPGGSLRLFIYAKSGEHAFKIASDKFAQYKAEQMNL